jgi:KDO2-lipid IV(A) lauroyltransferase
MQVIPFGKAARQCLETLQKNRVLALAGDRDFSEKGLVLDFFGRPTFLPVGAAAFSLKTGCPIVPGFMVRDKDDKFTLRFERPVEYTPTQDRDKDLAEITKQCKTIIENYIRRYPDQWYMFRKFWINPSEEDTRGII